MPAERLQKIIAAAGVASRRKAEALITAGRVQVNGQVVTQLGSKADPERDHIRVDGKLLHGPQRLVYLALHKPAGYVTTASDPQGRPTVLHLVRSAGARVYPVGRLDYSSEGLLLLTNDGALAARLMHASSHVPKTYQVKVSGKPTEENLRKLRAGVVLPPDPRHPRAAGKGSRTAPARIRLLRDAPNPWYEVVLIEGQNRQIRRMFEAIGHHAEKVRRVRYGPLELDLEPGRFRRLTSAEIAQLKSAAAPPRGGPEACRRGTKDNS